MKELTFAVIDKYAIPYDLETYTFCANRGVCATKIFANFLPTLADLFSVKIQTVSLKEMVADAVRKTEKFWTSTESFAKLVIKSQSCFVLTGALDQKERLKKIEATWRKFFVRWGFKSEFAYDETQTRCKMTISYEPTQVPDLQIEDEIKTEATGQAMQIGNMIFKLAKIDQQDMLLVSSADKPEHILASTPFDKTTDAKDQGLLVLLFNQVCQRI